MRHYHVIDPESHPDNRSIYYHDHPGSFIIDGIRPLGPTKIIHDHNDEPATYVGETNGTER